MTGPDDPQSQLSEPGQPGPILPAQQSWQPQPSWQAQPSWEPQHSWDQPLITEVTPPGGDEEPVAAQPVGYQPVAYPLGVYPPGAYPPGAYPPAGYPLAEPARRPRRRWSWILGAAVAVLLLALGGGTVAAYQVLNGGGTQPDQVVPADTVAFAKLDLNPSASQKIAAARFLHRIPKLGGGFGGSSDWRKAIFDALASGDSLPPGVNFDRDVKPWLGKRAAVAVLPTLHDGDPEVLLVLQSTDEAKARAGIARFGSDNGVSFYRGYAVVGQTQQIADQAVASAKASDLAGSAHYSADLKQLGSLGVSSGWADLGAAFKLAGTAGRLNLATTGRLAYTVRLTAGSVELIGKFYGLSGSETAATRPDLDGLPAGTALAVGVGTSPAAIDRSWKRYEDLLSQLGGAFSDPSQPGLVAPDPSEMLDTLQQEFGIALPDDLKTLVGTGVTAAVAADGLTGDTPKFALQSHTNGAAAVQVMDNIRHGVDEHGGDFPLEYRATPNGLIVGNDPDYLATVSSAGGAKLSSLPAFRQSLPDRAGAEYLAFVNLDSVAASMRASGASQDELQAISAFSAAGVTVRTGGTTASLHVRLLVH